MSKPASYLSKQRRPGKRVPSYSPFQFHVISRSDALSQTVSLLEDSLSHPKALHLIALFQFDPEELSEEGLSFEALKNLERKGMFLR
jgi:hypothetical protein